MSLLALPASPHASHASPAEPRVLRFRSGDLVLDLADWPADWETRSDEALVALARAAQPPALGMGTPAAGAPVVQAQTR